MEHYIIKTVDGATIPINEDECKAVIEHERKGVMRVLVGGAWLRLNTFNIYPENQIAQTEGYLHDGTHVIKKFGQWVSASNPDTRLDPAYYPEIAKDEVMTVWEHKRRKEAAQLDVGEELKQLSNNE